MVKSELRCRATQRGPPRTLWEIDRRYEARERTDPGNSTDRRSGSPHEWANPCKSTDRRSFSPPEWAHPGERRGRTDDSLGSRTDLLDREITAPRQRSHPPERIDRPLWSQSMPRPPAVSAEKDEPPVSSVDPDSAGWLNQETGSGPNWREPEADVSLNASRLETQKGDVGQEQGINSGRQGWDNAGGQERKQDGLRGQNIVPEWRSFGPAAGQPGDQEQLKGVDDPAVMEIRLGESQVTNSSAEQFEAGYGIRMGIDRKDFLTRNEGHPADDDQHIGPCEDGGQRGVLHDAGDQHDAGGHRDVGGHHSGLCVAVLQNDGRHITLDQNDGRLADEGQHGNHNVHHCQCDEGQREGRWKEADRSPRSHSSPLTCQPSR